MATHLFSACVRPDVEWTSWQCFGFDTGPVVSRKVLRNVDAFEGYRQSVNVILRSTGLEYTSDGRFVAREEGHSTDVNHEANAVPVEADVLEVTDRDVFVVHGRNEAARVAMFEFLRALDLHPMEWSEVRAQTGQASPYIGEVLDTAFSHARAIVVLLTPDDEARTQVLASRC